MTILTNVFPQTKQGDSGSSVNFLRDGVWLAVGTCAWVWSGCDATVPAVPTSPPVIPGSASSTTSSTTILVSEHFSDVREIINSQHQNLITLSFLPPANEVWDKVIFSVACVKDSVHE